MYLLRLTAVVALLAPSAMMLAAHGGTVTTQPAASQPALPTVESIQALYDAGNFKEALKSASALLSNRAAAGTFDRHAVVMQAAESQFHLQQNTTARNTLDAERKEAEAAGSTDDASQCGAFAYLIQKSAGHTFTPVTGKVRKPLDVFDPEARKQAYSALLDDALAMCQQKAKLAKSKTDYMVLLPVTREFVYVRALDRVVHGNSDQTDAFAKDTSGVAADIMERLLADYEAKAHIMEDSANEWIQGDSTVLAVHGGVTVNHWSRRRGLTGVQVSSLGTMKNSCNDMPRHIQLLSETFGNPDAFAKPFTFRYWWVYYHERPDLATASEDVKQRLEDLLNRDFTH